MKIVFLTSLLFSLLGTSLLASSNVLVIGSSKAFNEREQGAIEGRLDPAAMAKALELIFNQGRDASTGARVVFEDVYRKKASPVALGSAGRDMPTMFHCHSLAQYHFWPDGREKRMAMLAGEAGTRWNVVVLLGDPYLMQTMPGIYAEGVHLLTKQVRKGGAKVVLLMPWSAQRIGYETAMRMGQLRFSP